MTILKVKHETKADISVVVIIDCTSVDVAIGLLCCIVVRYQRVPHVVVLPAAMSMIRPELSNHLFWPAGVRGLQAHLNGRRQLSPLDSFSALALP